MTQLNIAVSTLPYMGLGIGNLLKLPEEFGIEIFSECGNDYYWEHWIPRLMEGRTGEFSVHAPFQNMDLSDSEADFEMLRKNYQWAFEICRRYGGKHCVCHPFEGSRPKDDTAESKKKSRECSLERVLKLNEEAQKYDVILLVENMPYKRGLLKQDEFTELFGPREELHFLIDTGHAHMQGWNMDRAFRELGNRILSYHVHDNKGDADSHLHIGEGTFDWENFFDGYLKYTPMSSLVCEYDNGPIDKIIKSAEWIRERIGK